MDSSRPLLIMHTDEFSAQAPCTSVRGRHRLIKYCITEPLESRVSCFHGRLQNAQHYHYYHVPNQNASHCNTQLLTMLNIIQFIILPGVLHSIHIKCHIASKRKVQNYCNSPKEQNMIFSSGIHLIVFVSVCKYAIIC